jgi:uncharacterized membrane protein
MTEVQNEYVINRKKYLDNTHYLNDYNEIYNTNTYLDDKTSTEVQRLDQIYGRMRSTLLRIKQEYMLKKFAISEINFHSYVLFVIALFIFTFIIMLTMYIENKLSHGILFSTVVITCIILLAIIIMVVLANNQRKETNWNQYYWDPIENKNKKTWGEWWSDITKE